MPLASYLYTYSVPSGRQREHDDWVRRRGRPYWEEQAGFRGYHSFWTLVGDGPDIVTIVDFDSPEHIVRALSSDAGLALWEEFEGLVEKLWTKIVVPTSP